MASTNRLSPIPHPPKKPVVRHMLVAGFERARRKICPAGKELGRSFWLDMMGTPFVVVSGTIWSTS